jgi:hypothetical protein
MRLALKLHPDSRPTAAAHIDVDVVRSGPGALSLRYIVMGPVGNLVAPAPAASTRTDELWKHTCFEAFIGSPASHGYCEFNFSPSSQWAAYRFRGYREGMTSIGELTAPKIAIQSESDSFALQAMLDLDWLPDLPRIDRWRVGLSAVIEDRDGGKAYWALAHPPGKPDFHHADGFACQVSVGESS